MLDVTTNCYYNEKVKFEWNDQKDQANRVKHGLSFHDAAYIFLGETITFKDERQDYGEERLITLGELVGRVVVVVHTERSQVIRVISMRKANERETKIYYQRLGKNRQAERYRH